MHDGSKEKKVSGEKIRRSEYSDFHIHFDIC